jgi:hypothetical protein
MQASKNHPISCGLTDSQFARSFTKQQISDRTADLDLLLEYAAVGQPGASDVVLGDICYSRAQPNISSTNYRAKLLYREEKFAKLKSLSSSDSAVLDVAENDPMLMEFQNAGQCIVTAELTNGEQILTSATTELVSDGTVVDQFKYFVEGTFARHLYDQIRIYANGSTSAPEHYAIYSTFNNASNTYQKNAGCWASPLDFSGMSVNQSEKGRLTAISPHHALGSTHYLPPVNSVVTFCDSNNQSVSRTVSNAYNVGDDCSVVRFSEALPASVKQYKTLPSNWLEYYPVNFNIYNGATITNNSDNYPGRRGAFLPIITTSHYRWDSAWPLQRSNRYAYIYQTWLLWGSYQYFYPANSEPNNFTNYNGEPSGIRGGDSGGPCFFVVNNDLVLMRTLGTSVSGPFLPALVAQINAALNILGPGGQTFETVDLSGFTNFG